MKPKREGETQWQQFSRYSSLAMLLPSSVLVGYLMGYFLDKLFGTHFLYLVFLFLGIAAGLTSFIREALKDK
jgi:F0F1-type ATP synthase assembly protein I